MVVLTGILFIQLAQGTDPTFAAMMWVAQLAAAIAFNRLGGMTHMGGAFCLFSILPNVTVSELAHLVLGQPGDYNLEHPLLTGGVCLAFFLCVMIAALVVTSLRQPEPYLDRIRFSILELRIVSGLSCALAVLIAASMLTISGPLQEGSFQAAVNRFFPILLAISIMLATYVRLSATGGKSGLSWYVAFLLILGVVPGLLSASKEGMLTPVFCWFVVVASSRHRFSWLGTAGLFGVLLLLWGFVYPFSQNARFPVREAESLTDKAALIIQFIRDPSSFPDSISEADEATEFGTSSSKVNIVARYSLLHTIDMLIDADGKVGYTSIDRYIPALFVVVPHAIWPDRPEPIGTNELGHKAGFRIDENNTETGIAIGSPALFFDIGGWLALIVYTLLSFFFFFLVTRRAISTTDHGVWGLVPIGTEALIAGAASVAGMFGLIVMFLGTFFVTIMMLKLISYFTEALISRPLANKI